MGQVLDSFQLYPRNSFPPAALISLHWLVLFITQTQTPLLHMREYAYNRRSNDQATFSHIVLPDCLELVPNIRSNQDSVTTSYHHYRGQSRYHRHAVFRMGEPEPSEIISDPFRDLHILSAHQETIPGPDRDCTPTGYLELD